MTKIEMINEILSNCKWNESAKKANVQRAMRKPKSSIEKIYKAFVADGKKYLFYAVVLCQ